MIDLDSDPTKLLEVVEIGKQLLMTRGCLTTFSIANDVAKYFAILPALFSGVFPEISPLNVMAPGFAAKRDPLGRDFQCHDHRAADSIGAAGRGVSAVGGRRAAASIAVDLWRGRRDRSVRGHQAR